MIEHKKLEQNKTDLLVSTSKSILGIVPFAGPILSELIGSLIPDQRIDRLTKYVIELEKRLTDIPNNKFRELVKDNECIDFFEESFIHASRANTDERRIQIASAVRNGLDQNAISYSDSKYILKLFQELNDQEIIWLRFYLYPSLDDDNIYRQKHSDILTPIFVSISADEKIRLKGELQDSYKEHLERLGLIRGHYNTDENTGIPEFDKFTGKPIIAYRNITTLGRLLLKQIGLDKENINI